MKLIDADDLIERIVKLACIPCIEKGNDYKGVKCRACQYGDEIYDIDSAPTIEERKTGDWEEIEVIQDAYDIYGTKSWASKLRCNRCSFTTAAIEGHIAQYKYCPSCGARMDGGRE